MMKRKKVKKQQVGEKGKKKRLGVGVDVRRRKQPAAQLLMRTQKDDGK